MFGTVLKVGAGRGFVIATEDARYVVTAAHCCFDALPDPMSSPGELCRALLGPLAREPSVLAECIFIDPVADLAVFGEPDGQEYDTDPYRRLTDSAPPFGLGKLTRRRQRHGPPAATSDALMLSLDGDWFACRITSQGRVLRIEDAAQPIRRGMSGSPIPARPLGMPTRRSGRLFSTGRPPQGRLRF
jgi:hypothetical protein